MREVEDWGRRVGILRHLRSRLNGLGIEQVLAECREPKPGWLEDSCLARAGNAFRPGGDMQRDLLKALDRDRELDLQLVTVAAVDVVALL